MDDVTIKFICGDSKEREAILERANREWAEIIHSSSGASYAWDAIADANEDLLAFLRHRMGNSLEHYRSARATEMRRTSMSPA